MTDKRFTIGDRALQEVYGGCIPAILDGGIPCTQSQVLKLLNELSDENGQLKHDATILIQSNQDYRKENERLRIKIRKLRLEKIHQNKENEQLKKALWCIRKRYGYTVEEFIEDLKDNGIDLTKVDLE